MTCFVTVGTTRFDELVAAVVAPDVLDFLHDNLGISHLLVQHGYGPAPPKTAHRAVRVEAFDFKPALKNEMSRADLIISHAGAGSLIESLRLKKRTVAVVNPSLMDNHQQELAAALFQRGYLVAAVASPAVLIETLRSANVNAKLTEYPDRDPRAFASLMDQEMGFR